jgi:hypothetical protein
MRKALLGVAAVLVGLPLLFYAAYALMQFQPRRSEIIAIVERAAPQDRQPPQQVLRMLKASEQSGPSVYASRLLARELNAFSDRGSMLGWHIRSTLWWSLVKLHLTEGEQTAVFLALAPTGKDRRGFTSTALALYQRQPADLSLAEVATIMALIRAPSAQGERLEQIRGMLLARYESGSSKR